MYEFVSELDQTNRGSGGFGSTDKRLCVTQPVPIGQKTGQLPPGGYIEELYKQAGGVPIKRAYSEEVRERDLR